MSAESWIIVAVTTLVLVTLFFTVRLLVQLVRARRRLREAGMPTENKVVFWAAVLYVLSPVDLMPDPVLIDDIGVLLLALKSLHSAAETAGLRPARKRGAD
ncbi:YkvA family protein [Streptomyces sp. GSL17-111]|uniref:YkvA family protein n=1 Tax=Streptomyces sp. GSL17-111 TaxID=3121596 RepID=UPI0030F43115